MTIFQSIFLGVLQGIAEFLPISSSGHLAVAQHLFALDDLPLVFDVMLHLATLLAVIIYYRKKLYKLICVFFCVITRKTSKIAENPDDGLCGTQKLSQMTIIAVIVATLITGVIGIFTSKFIPDLSAKYVCAGFIVTGALLIFSKIISGKTKVPTRISIISLAFALELNLEEAQDLLSRAGYYFPVPTQAIHF